MLGKEYTAEELRQHIQASIGDLPPREREKALEQFRDRTLGMMERDLQMRIDWLKVITPLSAAGILATATTMATIIKDRPGLGMLAILLFMLALIGALVGLKLGNRAMQQVLLVQALPTLAGEKPALPNIGTRFVVIVFLLGVLVLVTAVFVAKRLPYMVLPSGIPAYLLTIYCILCWCWWAFVKYHKRWYSKLIEDRYCTPRFAAICVVLTVICAPILVPLNYGYSIITRRWGDGSP